MADSRIPELIADLEAQTTAFLSAEQIPKHTAQIISRKLSRHLCSNWGGQLIYFPKNQSGELDERDKQIYAEFNGCNHHELAKKYNLTEQRIYRIVGLAKQQFLVQSQQDLFGGK